MKRKVKKFAEGSVVTSLGGATNMRTRFGKDEEDRPKSSGVEDYATLGKRASAVSSFSGPKEYISESIKEDTEKETESPKGIASGFKSGESKYERDDNEVKMPAAKRKERKSQDYKEKDPSAVLRAVKEITSESVKTPKADITPNRYPSILEGESSSPKKEYYRDFSGKIKEKTEDKNPKKAFSESISEGIKSFGSSLSDFASKNIKSPAQRRDEEKASKEKGFAKGGKVSSASSRGDGIAQRGKTKGRIC
jgi:hypothetical protein